MEQKGLQKLTREIRISTALSVKGCSNRCISKSCISLILAHLHQNFDVISAQVLPTWPGFRVQFTFMVIHWLVDTKFCNQ